MGTIGNQAKIVTGKNVSITLGSNTYAEAESIRMHYNYKVLEEGVASSLIPAFGTDVFHGEVELQELYSTDIDFIALTTPASNGDLPVVTMTAQLTDTEGSPVTKTLTALARLNDVEHSWSKGQFVKAMVKGVMTGPHTTN